MRIGKSYTAYLFAAVATLALAAPADANILISIDKSTQHMSVVVDGSPRYIWPVSTGRSGYDTPNGNFKPNRMDADHLSQEWDNAPMPHTIFFDLHGHAIHGFFDVKHLGLPVSHGCVRLSPDNAAILFNLVKTEGMANTSVTVSGQTPGGRGPAMVQQPSRQPAPQPVAGDPTPIAPDYGSQQQQGYYGQPVYGQRPYVQPSYGQAFPAQPQPYYGQPAYRQW
jgi:hypothetical protein